LPEVTAMSTPVSRPPAPPDPDRSRALVWLPFALPAVGWLLLAGSLGGAPPGAEEGGGVAELRKLGAECRVDEKDPARPVVAVDLTGCDVTEAALPHLKALTQLRSLDL